MVCSVVRFKRSRSLLSPMPDERSVGAVIFRETEDERAYLLLHYQGGHWGHVKGHVEPNESREETLRREAEEEAALTDLELVDGFHETVTYTFRRKGKLVDKQVDFLLARTRTEDVRVTAPDEHQDLDWFRYEAALEQLTFPEPRQVLKKAHRFLDEAADTGLDRF